MHLILVVEPLPKNKVSEKPLSAIASSARGAFPSRIHADPRFGSRKQDGACAKNLRQRIPLIDTQIQPDTVDKWQLSPAHHQERNPLHVAKVQNLSFSLT